MLGVVEGMVTGDGHGKRVHGVLVKWGLSFVIAITRKNIVFRGERESHPLQNRDSFMEVSVVPISGQTSLPRRMYLAN